MAPSTGPSGTTIAVAAVVIVGAAAWASRRGKPTAAKSMRKIAEPGGVLPPNAPTPSPPPAPGKTTPSVADSMAMIGMSTNPSVYVVGVTGLSTCKLAHYGAVPAIARFDPFSASTDKFTTILMDVVTTLSFLRNDNSFAGCLRTVTNLKLSYRPGYKELSIDLAKKNPAGPCAGYDQPSDSYGVVPTLVPTTENGLLAVKGTLSSNPRINTLCAIGFINVTMVPTVKSLVIGPYTYV